jgi:hypothetical protein
MKKRLLLIFAVGISFSPVVFASGDVGPFNKANNGQEIYCATLHEWVKSDNSVAKPNVEESTVVPAGSMTFQSNGPRGNDG